MVCKPLFASNEIETPFELDPASSFYDSVQLKTVNILNNILLNKYDLSSYPALESRISIGVITDEEFADFLYSDGISLESVQEMFIEDFPVEVDYSLIENIVIQVIGDTGGSGTTSAIGENIRQIEKFLCQQENYYQDSLLSQNQNICAALSNPFSKIIELLTTARDLAAGIQDLVGNLNALITDMKYNSLQALIQDLIGKIWGFQQMLLDMIDNSAASQLCRLDASRDTLSRLFTAQGTMPLATYQFIKNKMEQIDSSFSEENLEEMKESIRKLFSEQVKQYEDALPDVLNFILINICNIMNTIQGAMGAPVNEVNTLMNNYTTTQNNMSGYSATKRNTIRNNGGRRTTPSQRTESRNTGRSNYNRSSPSSQIPSDITRRERDLIDNITSEGISGYLTFTANVQNMGARSKERFEGNPSNALFKKLYDPDENYHYTNSSTGGSVDAGWSKVQLGVWVRIMRALDAVRDQGLHSGNLIINSAYRSPFYNKVIAGQDTTRSYHISGMALDITNTNLSTRAGEELIRQASIHGFGGISFYPGSSFTHYDTGPVRTWNSNGKYTDVINDHLRK